ncbi:MAG: Hint domain-containing protein [Pseudomonadota bacterium]
MAIGEIGTLRRGGFGDGEIVRVDFAEPLDSAVIHLSSSNSGGNEFSLRVISVDANGFFFSLEEWEDEDGPHPAAETINWIAIEAGVHTLPDGRIIEAGTTTATTAGSPVALTADFGGTPAVLTNVMSNNGTDVVDSDPSSVTATGFEISLEEGSLSDGVNTGETVGYIAVQTGGDGSSGYASVQDGLNSSNSNFALGGTLNAGAVFGETQTLNNPGAGNVVIAPNDILGANPQITMAFDEETGDGNSGHGNETVGLVGFEIGVLLCFVAGTLIETDRGPVNCEELEAGARVRGADGALKTLRRVLRRTVTAAEIAADPRLLPIRISAGALGQGLPRRDLCVSRQHRMVIASRIAERMFGTSEILVPAVRLLEIPGISVDPAPSGATYVHLLFDDHEVILAEGAPSESLFTGAEAMKALPRDTREEILTLFPHLACPAIPVRPARIVPPRKRQKRCIARHCQNRMPLLSLWNGAGQSPGKRASARWEV